MGRVLDRMKKIDGVETAAIANGLIGGSYSGGRDLRDLVAEDESMPGRMSTWRTLEGRQAAVSPEFFAVTGIQVVSGRAFTPNDREGAPDVVMLSQSAAANLWPGMDPHGKRVRLANDPRWATVIGIFADPLRNRSDDKWVCFAGCVALTPWLQKPGRDWLVILRAAEPAAAAQQIVRAVASVDERVPVFSPSAANQGIFVPSNPEGLVASLFGALGVLSLAIAALGIYGVIRTPSVGARASSASASRSARRRVAFSARFDDAVHLVLVGLLPGVLLAAWSTRVLEAAIVNLMPNDIPTWAAVPIGVLIIGVSPPISRRGGRREWIRTWRSAISSATFGSTRAARCARRSAIERSSHGSASGDRAIGPRMRCDSAATQLSLRPIARSPMLCHRPITRSAIAHGQVERRLKAKSSPNLDLPRINHVGSNAEIRRRHHAAVADVVVVVGEWSPSRRVDAILLISSPADRPGAAASADHDRLTAASAATARRPEVDPVRDACRDPTAR